MGQKGRGPPLRSRVRPQLSSPCCQTRPTSSPGVIDMSSISPVAARRLASLTAAKGATMLDAPVSGGEIGAKSGSLSIMVGGDEATFARVRPVLGCMGNPERIIYIGESG